MPHKTYSESKLIFISFITMKKKHGPLSRIFSIFIYWIKLNFNSIKPKYNLTN